MSANQHQRCWVTAGPGRCRFFPFGETDWGVAPNPRQNFDKGFGDIAAASSHYAFFARHAYSARLRFYRHVLLLPKKSFDFSGVLPALRLGRSGCDPTSLKWDGSHYSDLAIVCNVNNIPKLLPTERNGAGDRHTNVGIQINRD